MSAQTESIEAKNLAKSYPYYPYRVHEYQFTFNEKGERAVSGYPILRLGGLRNIRHTLKYAQDVLHEDLTDIIKVEKLK